MYYFVMFLVIKTKLFSNTVHCSTEYGGGHYNWNSSQVLGATVIALGERQDMEKAEKDYLRMMVEEEDVDTEPPPPKKSKRLNAGKENKGCTQTPHRNRATTRRPLSNIQKVIVLYL